MRDFVIGFYLGLWMKDFSTSLKYKPEKISSLSSKSCIGINKVQEEAMEKDD